MSAAPTATLELLPDPLEVEETRWISKDELHAEIARQPESFTPWFRIYAERYPDLVF
jgi:isopentenyl-diphosphate delta-isomerase